MAITRPTLTTGIKEFVDGQVLVAADLETEFLTLYNGISNLDDADISATANIDPSKLGDFSATATEQKSSATPGTGSSVALATTMEEEIKQLRYTIERLALGISGTSHAVRYDGSANQTIGWIEIPHRYGTHTYNGDFSIKGTGVLAAPDGWTIVGNPTNCAQAVAVVTEGAGAVLNITSDHVTEGVSQTFAGLKASTRYLAVVRARANAGTARMTLSGASASSQFRDITVDSTSSAFVTLKAVVETDSTPSAIVMSLLAAGNADDVDFCKANFYECSSDALYPVNSVRVRTVDVTTHASGVPSGSFSAANFLQTAVIPPGPGYTIRVRAQLDLMNVTAGSRTAIMVLRRNGTDVSCWRSGALTSATATATLEDLFVNPVAGTLYTYTVEGYGVAGAFTINAGAIATETPTSTLVLELEHA